MLILLIALICLFQAEYDMSPPLNPPEIVLITTLVAPPQILGLLSLGHSDLVQ